MYNYYITLLGYPNIPEFLNKYLTLSSLNRLKEVGYFCGMDYASSNIYNFKEYINYIIKLPELYYFLIGFFLVNVSIFSKGDKNEKNV